MASTVSTHIGPSVSLNLNLNLPHEKEITRESADCSLSLIRAVVRKLWIWLVVGISFMVISGVDGSLEAHMLTATNTEIHKYTHKHTDKDI